MADTENPEIHEEKRIKKLTVPMSEELWTDLLCKCQASHPVKDMADMARKLMEFGLAMERVQRMDYYEFRQLPTELQVKPRQTDSGTVYDVRQKATGVVPIP